MPKRRNNQGFAELGLRVSFVCCKKLQDRLLALRPLASFTSDDWLAACLLCHAARVSLVRVNNCALSTTLRSLSRWSFSFCWLSWSLARILWLTPSTLFKVHLLFVVYEVIVAYHINLGQPKYSNLKQQTWLRGMVFKPFPYFFLRWSHISPFSRKRLFEYWWRVLKLFFARNLCSPFSRLRKTYCYRLLSAFYFPAASATFKLATLIFMHGLFYFLLGQFAVFCHKFRLHFYSKLM